MAEPLHPYPLAFERHPTLRQSLLAKVDQCPLSARLELEFERGWSSHLAAMGIIFHRFAAKCVMEMHRQDEDHIDPDSAQAIMSETLHQADEDELVAITAEHIADLRWMAPKFALDFQVDIASLVDVEQTLSTDVRYVTEHGEPVTRRITGKLDALLIENANGIPASHAIVPDYKSGWGLPPEKQISDSGYFQQRVYGLLVLANYPSVRQVTLREWYARRSEVREGHIGRDQLELLREEVAALAHRFDRMAQAAYSREQRIKGGEQDVPAPRRAFGAAPGSHCAYCAAPGLCPIYKEARREGMIESPEEAAVVAEELIVAKAQVKRRQDALRAWTAAHGPTPIRNSKDADRRWGPVESLRNEKPTQEQVEEALAQGRNPAELYRQVKTVRYQDHSPRQRNAA